MTGINGNFGLFGNNGNRKIGINPQKANEVKTNVPLTESKKVENKELGDDLLTANTFYPGVNLHKKAKAAVQPGSLEDLTQTVTTLNLSNITNVDKKEAFNLAKDPLVKAYMYGNISSTTTDVLSQLDGGLDSLPEFMLDDLLAYVEIA